MTTTQRTTRQFKNLSAAQRWVLVLSSLASFLVVLDLLVVATALSSIQRSLGASLADLEWTVNAYTLSFAAFLMTAAMLGGRFGRRRVFVAGLALFGVASAGCALAPGVAVLIAARTIQGLGAAAVMPMALALLNTAFPAKQRGWATGIYGSFTAMGVVLGPVLGGAVAQGLSWQWIFWLNVPLALLAIPLVVSRIPEGYGPVVPIDLPGVALGAAAALGLIWGLIRAGYAGWSSLSVLGLLGAGAALTIAFLGWERRSRSPMLPLRLFRSRAFSAGNGAIFLLNGAVAAAVFFTAQYLQIGLGHDPLPAGLRLLPWGVAPVLIAPYAGTLADRFGERLLVVAGLALTTVGMGWLALIGRPGTGYPLLVLPITVSGIGFALAIPAVTKSVVSSVRMADIGTASGTYSTMRQLGGAFGVALGAGAFAAHGGYHSAAAFSTGYRAAMVVCALLGLAGLGVATALHSRSAGAAPAEATEATEATAPEHSGDVEVAIG